MPCLLNTDQPLRVQLSNNGVIHAGRFYTTRPHTSITWVGEAENRIEHYHPAKEVVQIACSWKDTSEEKIVSNNKSITCKNCMKRMGMVEGPIFPTRFVVRKKDTGEFYKNTTTRCSEWADDISDAFLFKRECDALRHCTNQRYRSGGVINPNKEVKKVKIILED